LPKKLLIMNENDLEHRKIGLINFLIIILNDTLYWNELVFKWVNL